MSQLAALPARPKTPATSLASGVLQRKCACGQHTTDQHGQCTECGKKRLGLQRRAVNAGGPEIAPPIVHEVLRSPGRPLDPTTRTFMESRFNYDFSPVRLHIGTRADASANAVNALAFTVGNNIVFRGNSYQPKTNAGKELLAHELTHTIQQSGYSGVVQPSLALGPTQSAEEIEAERVAEQVVGDNHQVSPPKINQKPQGLTLNRRRTTPQRRGGPAQLATLDQPPQGQDQVRIHVFRYLCDCVGRDVSRSSLTTRLQPRPGVVYQFCRGRTTVRILGEVNPSSLTSGTATATIDINVAPERGGAGGRVQVQGEARNIGDEPQAGGRLRIGVRIPGGTDIAGTGEIFAGTETGRVDTSIGGEVRIGGLRIFLQGTNLQDERRRGGIIGLGGTFGGPEVSEETCRVCDCPIVYECVEDIPPRDYEVQVTENVEDRERLRYYFRLNTNQDARDPNLRRESSRALSNLSTLVSNGWAVAAITGFASPEFARPTRGSSGESENEQLSLRRAERLRELVARQLGPTVTLPQPQAGGELLGRRATISPGSGLRDAILSAGFRGPEEVTDFLLGDAIEDDQLADQFLALLDRVDNPDDRLRLFGLTPSSPLVGQLQSAIEQFIARGGRGRRPWERLFEYLRFASVEVTQTRQETHTEQRRTRGSFRPIGETICRDHARQAEREDMFGPVEREPSRSECPPGEPRNRADYAEKCDYGS